MSNLPPLRPNDPLGRAEYSQSRAKSWRKGKADHRTFSVKEDEISVDRLGHASDSVLAGIHRRHADGRGASGFYGWAVVTVEKANQSGRMVRPDPIENEEPKNPYHAVIKLNIASLTDRDEKMKEIATELVAWSTWRNAPT